VLVGLAIGVAVFTGRAFIAKQIVALLM